MPDPKSEFENTTGGYIGVLVKDHTGRMRGVPVNPGATIWLDEDEQIATANAPRRDEDNPFTNGALALRTPATEIANRRPIGHTERPQVNEVRQDGEEDAPPAEDPPSAEGEGDAASASGGGEEAAPGASDEPDPEKAEEPKEKPVEEMSQEEIDKHNAKEAAKRAMPSSTTPKPQAEGETGAAKQPTGKAPEGKRTATEQVGTPEAAQKA